MAGIASQAVPRIAIIGGGPGGLTLLRTLQHRRIRATLYEREPAFNSRAHLGGTLDLGWGSGQRAFRENGLEDQFKAHSRPEGEEAKLIDASGNVTFYNPPDGHPDPLDLRPEIDRSDLRKIFLDAIPPDYIKWGHGLASVTPLDSGKHELVFSNGVKTICDFLVGADGAYSRVRPLLSPAVPIYHGVTGAEISVAPEVARSAAFKDTADLVGHGSAWAAQDQKVLGGQRNSDGRIRTYAWFRGPADWVLPKEPDAARKVLLDIYKGWAPVVLKLIEHCDDAAIYHRPLYYLPVGHRWDHVTGVTLIGDAAHLMSPFAGAGANLAMLDGLKLGLVLAEGISNGKSVEEMDGAIKEWEENMFVSSAKITDIAMKSLESTFNTDYPSNMADEAREFMSNPKARREA